MFSTPTHLGRTTVNAQGFVTVTTPANIALGSHRLVATAADGTVIGWRWITVVEAQRLASTGAGHGQAAMLAGLAALLMLGGAATLAARRRAA